jgi:hypothetical protein
MSRSNVVSLVRVSGLALLLLLAAACGATSGGGGGGNPDLITRAQIEELPEGTALTVVQRFRSAWLRPRSQGTFSGGGPDYAAVFVDEMRFGDINALSRISSANIESIQFISATDATTRYGTGYAGGIIRVNTIGR